MPEELEDEFGDIIKKARAGLGYNPDAVAHMTSIAVDDIISMETYKLKPTREQVMVLASVLGLDADKLAAIADGSWHPEPRHPGLEGAAIVERIKVPLGAYGSNCYILGCVETGKAAVIDPGGAVDRIEEVLQAHNLSLAGILITHGHMDHTGGLSELMRKYPSVPIFVDSAEMIHGPEVRHPEDGEEFSLGGLTLKALATPGHTVGSTSYYTSFGSDNVRQGICFVGDTLFAGSVGGTSIALKQELDSIRDKIFTLLDDTILLPGHGPATTVGEEKANNAFF